MIKRHEGIRHKVYLDSLGIPTVGCGFNLLRSGAAKALAAVGADFDAVKSGDQLLTDAQIDKLLETDLRDCYIDLCKFFFNDFDSLPESARAVLVDMRFQLGPTRLRGFKNTMKAFADRRWKDAAAGIKASAMYKQVPKRCDENIALLLAIK